MPKGSNPGPTVFVEVRMLKDSPAIIGTDLSTYGPFTEGNVYAIPKENARVFIKLGVAVATRKEATKPTLKEMFKGESLMGYVEAAKTKPLVEERARKIPAYMGPIWEGTDEEKVIAQIIHNCEYWHSQICKRETLEKYCSAKGVENPGAVIDDLIRRGIVYTPKHGYVGFTDPEKYRLGEIGIEEPAPEFKIGEYVVTQDGETLKVIEVRKSDILKDKVTYEYLLQTVEGPRWYHISAIERIAEVKEVKEAEETEDALAIKRKMKEIEERVKHTKQIEKKLKKLGS